jgi:hypothetical protein
MDIDRIEAAASTDELYEAHRKGASENLLDTAALDQLIEKNPEDTEINFNPIHKESSPENLPAKGEHQVYQLDPELAPMKHKNLWDKIKDVGSKRLSWVLSPLSAPAAFIQAPIAYKNYQHSGWDPRQGVEGFAVGAKAAIEHLFPTYGEEPPNYAQQIVESFVPNMPDSIKPTATMALALALDPLTIGTGGAVFVKEGLKIQRMQQTMNAHKATKAEQWKGLAEGAVQRFMGMDIFDPVTKAEIQVMAKAADSGNKGALKKIIEMFGSKETVARIAGDDIAESERRLRKFRKLTEGNVDEQLVGEIQDIYTRFGQKIEVSDAAELASKNFFNPSTLTSSVELMNHYKAYASHLSKTLLGKLGKSQKHAETIAKAQQVELQDLMGIKIGQPMDAAQLLAARTFAAISESRIRSLAKFLKKVEPNSKTAKVAFRQAIALHKDLSVLIKSGGKTAGQAVDQYKIAIKNSSDDMLNLDYAIANLDESSTNEQVFAQIVDSIESSDGLHRAIAHMDKAKIDDALYEWWINMGLLSGPRTHAINILSNATAAFASPFEEYATSAVQFLGGNTPEAAKSLAAGNARVVGLVGGISDAFKILSKHGTPGTDVPEFLLRQHELAEHRKVIGSAQFQADGWVGQFLDAMGAVTRLPGKMLLSGDKYSKIVAYRMSLHERAAMQAVKKSTKYLDPSTGKKIIDKQAKARVYADVLRNPRIADMKAAAADAAYRTFTNPLTPKGQMFANALTSGRISRWFFPFVRTPVNIIKYGIERSPIAPMLPHVTADILAGGIRREVALGRVAMGTGAAMALSEVLGLEITGGYPKNSGLAFFAQQESKPEYSIKIGGKWRDYSQIVPLNSMLGVVANGKQALQHLDMMDPESEKQAELIASAVSAPFIQALRDSGFAAEFGVLLRSFEGMGDFENGAVLFKHLKKTAASMVPNIVNQLNRAATQETVKMAESTLEMVYKRIPILSDTLPNYKNIYGDDINIPDGFGPDFLSPVYEFQAKDNPVSDEILRLRVNLPRSPKFMVDDMVKLNVFQQSRFAELRGRGIEGVPTLKEAWAELMQSEEYKSVPDDGKKAMIRQVLQYYSEGAKEALLQEDQSLMNRYLRAKQIQAMRKTPQ